MIKMKLLNMPVQSLIKKKNFGPKMFVLVVVYFYTGAMYPCVKIFQHIFASRLYLENAAVGH